MKNNNWIEEFDENFRIMHLVEVDEIDGTFAIESDRDKVKNFILNLLTKKDQEHKAELEMIKGELKEYFEGLIHVASPRLTGNNIISILDSHINKLNTE